MSQFSAIISSLQQVEHSLINKDEMISNLKIQLSKEKALNADLNEKMDRVKELITPSVSVKDILAMVATATKEERAQLVQLLAGAKPAKNKVEERLSEEVLGERPEMPEEVELDEDFCHARVGVKLAKEDIVDSDKDDWLGRSSGLKFGGFKSKIFLESQCTNTPSSGQTLCSGCAKKFEKHQEGKDQEKWTTWNGIIGEAPPKKNRYIGSEYSNKVYADWGAAPNSGPSSSKKSSAGGKVNAKVEVKKEIKPKKPMVQKNPYLDIIENE
jgi:hypothetical protein